MRGKRESWNKFSESLPQMKLGNGHIGVIILFHVLLYVIDIFKKGKSFLWITLRFLPQMFSYQAKGM